MPRKTATINRWRPGCVKPHLRLLYRGKYVEFNGALSTAQADDPKAIPEMLRRAKLLGFTHVKYTGDWYEADRPGNGKIK